MRLLVTIVSPDGLPLESRVCEPGEPLSFSMRSQYLISAGQAIDIGVSVFDADFIVTSQMGPREDARHLTQRDGETPLIVLPQVWDVSFIPSTRLLADILAEAVQHGMDFPSHGVDCACNDRFVREIRLQVSKAIPPDGRTSEGNWAEGIHERITAKARIKSILHQMVRNL